MKLPRDVDASRLVKALGVLGYERVRQDGSHIRLTSQSKGIHHITVPNHKPIKLGTLAAILRAIEAHHELTMEELLRRLDL